MGIVMKGILSKSNGIKFKNLTKIELLKNLFIGAFYCIVLSYLFFKSLIISAFSLAFVYFYIKKADKLKAEQNKDKLREEFKEAIYSLSAALSGGRSVENAFIISLEELKKLYSADEPIVLYWEEIIKKISMNVPIEKALSDFAASVNIEEIDNFVSIFSIAKHSGGNLIEMIKHTTSIINEKLELSKDLKVLVANKKYEQKILMLLIPAMILFFNIMSPALLSPLYQTLNGRIVMMFCLLLYIGSVSIGRKIVDIKV